MTENKTEEEIIKPILGNKIKDFTKNKNNNNVTLNFIQSKSETKTTNKVNIENIEEKKFNIKQSNTSELKNQTSISITKLNFSTIINQQKNYKKFFTTYDKESIHKRKKKKKRKKNIKKNKYQKYLSLNFDYDDFSNFEHHKIKKSKH